MPEIRSKLQMRYCCLKKNEIIFPLMNQGTTDTVVPARTCLRGVFVWVYMCMCVPPQVLCNQLIHFHKTLYAYNHRVELFILEPRVIYHHMFLTRTHPRGHTNTPQIFNDSFISYLGLGRNVKTQIS
jgi:hypothetical protein